MLALAAPTYAAVHAHSPVSPWGPARRATRTCRADAARPGRRSVVPARAGPRPVREPLRAEQALQGQAGAAGRAGTDRLRPAVGGPGRGRGEPAVPGTADRTGPDVRRLRRPARG